MINDLVQKLSILLDNTIALIAGAYAWLRNAVEPFIVQADQWIVNVTSQAGVSHRLGLIFLSLVALFCVFALLLILARGGRSRMTRADLRTLNRRPRRLGALTALCLLFGFGGWSLAAPLASATVAYGVVSPEGNRKSVAHLEGGIIKTLHVAEGDYAEEGTPLVTLEDVRATAELEEMKERRIYLRAVRARLEAQQTRAEQIVYPDDLATDKSPSVSRILETQADVLAGQLATLASRENIYRQQIKQLEAQNEGLADVAAAIDVQLELLSEEIKNTQSLLDKGLAQAPRVLALRREHADALADRARNRAAIAQNHQMIGGTEIELLTLNEEIVSGANEELTVIDAQLAELDAQIPQRSDVLQRTIIRAPISGIVLNVRSGMEFGVVRPGEPILEIVPVGAPLVIDARVRPNDIDRVYPGMETRVILSAYKQRNLPLIHGRLRTISADRLIEDRTGEAYFLAKVEVSTEDIDAIQDIQLVPGMPAEVMILNGEQTLVGYLMEPLLTSVRRSFREN